MANDVSELVYHCVRDHTGWFVRLLVFHQIEFDTSWRLGGYHLSSSLRKPNSERT